MMATAKRASERGWLGIVYDYAVPLILVVWLALLLFVWGPASRRNRAILDESRRNAQISLGHQARMIQLLEQVVALLEKQRDKPGSNGGVDTDRPGA
jgi:hypothetical protein